ncbi:hypothetical protein FAVG1_08351 [Fusarium avenaceum]|nr:hypothetical protein FAVG1_08351 [Fusarium avenaceum]
MSIPTPSPSPEAQMKHWCDSIHFELVGTDCSPDRYFFSEEQKATLSLESLRDQAGDCEFCQKLAELILYRLDLNTKVSTGVENLIVLKDVRETTLTIAVRGHVVVPNWSFSSEGYSLRKVITIWMTAGSKHFDIVLQRAGAGGHVPVSINSENYAEDGDVEFLPPGSWRVDQPRDDSSSEDGSSSRDDILSEEETTAGDEASPEEKPKKVIAALQPTFGRPRPLLIDFEMLKKWMQLCGEQHNICQHHEDQISIPRFRLIDVNRKCIVQVGGDRRPPFATLSYVWGRRPFLRLVKANVSELEQEGSLEMVELPPTIRDAITVCEKLQVEYLWIDSLCIIQDDESVMLEVVDKMDSIYRESILTLIAASGTDAYSGIPGVRPGTRFLEQHTLEIRGVQLIDSVDEHQFDLHSMSKEPEWVSGTPWAQRAWTFQEALVSRKSLFFTAEQVYWNCREGLMSEDTTEYVDPDSIDRLEEDRMDSDYSPGQYENIAVAFSTRRLTYEADIGRAYLGTQTYLDKKWGGHRFSWGLPHGTFGPFLVWEWPFGSDRRLREGTHAVREHDGSIVKVPFPSWSWMAWTEISEDSRLMTFYGDEQRPHSPWFFVFNSAAELVAVPYGESYDEVSPLAKLLANGTGFRRAAVTEDVLPPELHTSPSLRHIALSFYTEVATVRYNPSVEMDYPPRDLQMISHEYPFSIKIGQRFYRIFEQDQTGSGGDGWQEVGLVAVFSGQMTKPRKFRGEYRLYCWPVVKRGGLRVRASDSSTIIFLRLWRDLPKLRWELVTMI